MCLFLQFLVDSIAKGAPKKGAPTTPSTESGAGVNAEFSDDDFRDAGAEILSDASAVMNKVAAPGMTQ